MALQALYLLQVVRVTFQLLKLIQKSLSNPFLLGGIQFIAVCFYSYYYFKYRRQVHWPEIH